MCSPLHPSSIFISIIAAFDFRLFAALRFGWSIFSRRMKCAAAVSEAGQAGSRAVNKCPIDSTSAADAATIAIFGISLRRLPNKTIIAPESRSPAKCRAVSVADGMRVCAIQGARCVKCMCCICVVQPAFNIDHII